MKIYDASGAIVGRLASRVAKDAILGEEVAIINVGDAIITGSKEFVLSKYERKRSMGQHHKGPFIHRTPEKFFKRIIRGMLPHKESRGVLAFKRIKCYNGVPDGLNIDVIKNSRTTIHEFVTVKDLLRQLGGKQ
ncbi:50S ribosomal protein L13 [Candidatus Woesearchaeota archaeon]|nr:50S ribosomal protein L13 [Candidatus Woesearchaeota archaeon]